MGSGRKLSSAKAADLARSPDALNNAPSLRPEWILATAVAGAADLLVAGDRDLLDVAADAPLRILDPRAFWELVRAGTP